MSKDLPKEELDRQIIQVIEEKGPENVEQLVKLMQDRSPLSKQEILNHILDLQKKEKIRLKPDQTLTPQKLTSYLRSSQAYWYWITIILALATAIVTFTISEDAFPIVYARYILGSVFVLWLPGYSFIKALFPTRAPIQTGSEDLDRIERVALSIGMSIALVPIVGLLLNYTPWGIRLTPITISLLALTIVFATAAAIREHRMKTSQNRGPES